MEELKRKQKIRSQPTPYPKIVKTGRYAGASIGYRPSSESVARSNPRLKRLSDGFVGMLILLAQILKELAFGDPQQGVIWPPC